MRWVAIEYNLKNWDKPFKGMIRIPDTFPGSWQVGFRKYLKEEQKALEPITIYPYKLELDSDWMGDPPKGYRDMTNEFCAALRNRKYYPISPENDAIRRAYSSFSSQYQNFYSRKVMHYYELEE